MSDVKGRFTEMSDRAVLEAIAEAVYDPTRPLIADAVAKAKTAARDAAAQRMHDRYYRVAELVGAGIMADGEHHKQWFLEQIYTELGLDPERMGGRRGVAP